MSFISTFLDRSHTTPCDDAFIFVDYDTEGGDQVDQITWRELNAKIVAVSAYLENHDVHAQPQRVAAISAPQGLDYVVGFRGTMCRVDSSSAARTAGQPTRQADGAGADRLRCGRGAYHVVSGRTDQGSNGCSWAQRNYADNTAGYISGVMCTTKRRKRLGRLQTGRTRLLSAIHFRFNRTSARRGHISR